MQNRKLTASELWHKRHLKTVSAKLRTKEYQRFQAVCAAAGMTPYCAIQTFCKTVTMADLMS